MTSQPKLAVVIPTLNEAANISIVLDRLRGSLDPLHIPYELIVVDDDSGDGIDAIVHEISRSDPRVKLLIRVGKRGLAGAVIHGWEATNAEVLGVIDADLQHPPELLPKLWEALQSGADAAVASRYAPQGSLKNWSKWRHFISLTSIWITLPLQRPGISVKDPMSGFFLVRRAAIDGIELQKQGFKILLEILVRGKLKSVLEVPFAFGHRHAGESKAGLKVAVDYFVLLARLWWKR